MNEQHLAFDRLQDEIAEALSKGDKAAAQSALDRTIDTYLDVGERRYFIGPERAKEQAQQLFAIMEYTQKKAGGTPFPSQTAPNPFNIDMELPSTAEWQRHMQDVRGRW